MGGWKLEVAKMALYMAFPVALFHAFNQPEYFEKWLKDTRSQMNPPIDENNMRIIEDTIREVRELKERKAFEKIAK